ncbi:ATP-binding protein, partial [Paraburkholderia xenovorans]
FGKRSEAKDAQDRHANIEVSYLLQRLENYPGLVILSTNNRSHLDDAFSRRFTFITRFTFPDVALRETMWRTIWPKGIPLSDDLDFGALARRTDITGASIRNIALLASWLASENPDGRVTLAHIEVALKRELAKVGRLIM